MSFSFSSLIRLIDFSWPWSTALWRSDSRRRSTQPRKPAQGGSGRGQVFNLNEYFPGLVPTGRPRWLDAETVADFRPIRWMMATSWRRRAAPRGSTTRGRYQVAGRWSSRTKDGPDVDQHSTSAWRATSFPGGTIARPRLDRDRAGRPPCWFPRNPRAILFTPATVSSTITRSSRRPRLTRRRIARGRTTPTISTPLKMATCPRPGLRRGLLDPSWGPDPARRPRPRPGRSAMVEPDSVARRRSAETSLWLRSGSTTLIVEAGFTERRAGSARLGCGRRRWGPGPDGPRSRLRGSRSSTTSGAPLPEARGRLADKLTPTRPSAVSLEVRRSPARATSYPSFRTILAGSRPWIWEAGVLDPPRCEDTVFPQRVETRLLPRARLWMAQASTRAAGRDRR